MKRRIVRYDQSPMNKKRWLVELECGHEIWRNGKPRGEMMECTACEAESASDGVCAGGVNDEYA